MFEQWLEEHQQEIVANYIAIRRQVGDTRPEQVLRMGVEMSIGATINALKGEVEWGQAVMAGARNFVDAGGSLGDLAGAAYSLFMAIQQVLDKHRPEQCFEWLSIIAAYTLNGSQRITRFLESHLSQQIEDVAIFRSLAENAVDGISMGDLEGRQIYGNRAVYELFGYDYESREMDGLPLTTFWPEEDVHILTDEVLPQAMAGGWSGEVRQKRKDGSLFDAHLTVFPILDDEGQPIRAAAIIRDITEQKRAEEELQRLATIVESSPDFVGMADPSGVGLYLNPAGLEMIGYTEEEFYGDILTIEDLQPDLPIEALSTAIEQGMWRGETVLVGKDGRRIPVSQVISVVRDEGGRVVALTTIARDITEQKQAEEELRRLSRAVEATSDAVMITDTQGIIRFVNRAFEQITGYSREEVLGQTPNILKSGQQLPEFYAEMWNTITAGKPWLGEVVNRRKDGTLYDAQLYISPVLNEAGEIEQFIATQRDITEQKQAERELEEQRRFLRLVIDISPNFIFVRDREGRFVLANRAVAEAYGTTVEDLTGKTDADFNPNKEEVERLLAEDREIMDSLQEKFIPEALITDANGVARWYQVIKLPLVDEDGVARRVLGIASDITEQKQIELALRDSEEKFRSLAETAHTGIFIIDDTFHFTYANEELARIVGRPRDEVVGLDFREVLDEESKQLVAERYVRRQSGETLPSRYEFNVERPDGEIRRVEISVAAVRDASGRTWTMGQLSDITEQKRLEMEVQESLERRARQVQTVTEVAQEIAAAPALDELFRRVVTLIKERFGYYHSQIFRYEPALDAVVLVVGYGETGEKMLAAGHRLEMGRGVVGTAAATGRPVLASDVTQDKDWVPNPFLPDTKGELAVPIKLGEDVLGILDVQSDIAGALTEEDQLLLEGLCGQIAIAIESTRLRQEMEEHLEELEHLARAMSREGWETFRRRAGDIAYLFDRTDVRPAEDFWTPEMALAAERGALVPPLPTAPQGGAAVSPLMVRGEIIGALGVREDPQEPLSPDDLALVEEVAEQVAQALETARLFEQTQAALADVELLYRASEQVVRSTNEDELLRAFVHNTVLGTMDRVTLLIFENPLRPGEEPSMVQVGAAWERDGRLPQPPPGTWYDMKHFPVTKMLNLEEPLVIPDVMQDRRLSHPNVQALFERLSTRGLAYWPLEAGQRWVGLIAAHSSEPLTLSEEEIRMIDSLSDQAAAVLQSIHLLNEARENAVRAQALRAIADAIIASETLEDLVGALPSVTEHLRKLAPVDALSLAVYTPGETEYTIFAVSWGEKVGEHFVQQGDRLSVEGTAPGWVITHGEPLLEPDIRESMNFVEDPRLVDEGILSRLVLPMRVGGRVIGTLNLGSRQVGGFTEEHLRLQQQIANQMAMATERIILLQETRRALAEAEATHRAYVRRGWRDYLRQQEMLRKGGFLYDREETAVAEGGPEPTTDFWRPEMGEAITAGHVTIVEEEEGRTGMAIPIILRGQTIGVLGVEDPTGERRWTERERVLMEAIGRQLALALENARLLGETQRRAERDRLIADITARVRASMDPETILRTAVRELGAALGTDRAFVHLGTAVDADGQD